MTIKLKHFLFALILIASLAKTYGQEGDKLGSWYVYNGFFNFSPKVELFFESQWRTWEPISNTQTLFFRPFISYNFTPNFQIGLSQEYHMNWSYSEISENRGKTEEYRTTLQAMLFQHIDWVSIQHRFRYEFRFLDEKGNQRVRYRLQLGIPISKKKIEKGVFFSTIGNEFMVNTQKELNLSQLRTYAMLGYQLSKSTNIQFGYMYISRPSAENLHRLQFFLTQKFKFYKTAPEDL